MRNGEVRLHAHRHTYEMHSTRIPIPNLQSCTRGSHMRHGQAQASVWAQTRTHGGRSMTTSP